MTARTPEASVGAPGKPSGDEWWAGRWPARRRVARWTRSGNLRGMTSTCRRPAAATFLTLALGANPTAGAQPDEEVAGRLARLALDCVHREYPNKIAHVLQGDGDARPPRELTPAFYGCYDWHSSVHGHWLLARLARLYPGAETAGPARAALARSLTLANLQREAEYLEAPGREGFERPYGLAWLLQLAAELREWDDPDARHWGTALAPVETLAAERIREWLPKLTHPIRSGEHSQTAFAFGLILDWARAAADDDMAALIESRVGDYYLADYDCPLRYEPSGHDFLSPCLAEADVVRRVMAPVAFAAWLRRFLPGVPQDGRADWLEPAVVTDPTDGKLVHLDGLNLSRAWMLEGIAAGLPAHDERRPALLAAAGSAPRVRDSPRSPGPPTRAATGWAPSQRTW